MSYITTYTGKHFDPVHPDMTQVDIHDIAHALSLICRGNGQVKSFFSVGQHCINAAKEAKERKTQHSLAYLDNVFSEITLTSGPLIMESP